jgi:hypothetical protein
MKLPNELKRCANHFAHLHTPSHSLSYFFLVFSSLESMDDASGPEETTWILKNQLFLTTD